jgi:hypothetical protein
MPCTKHHNGGRVTLSGKNFFGTWIESVEDVHPYLFSSLILGNPAPQTDLLAHKNIGGKTILYIGDGTFATKENHKTIAKFLMYPFKDDWTNSLFFSQDPVAIDSVVVADQNPAPVVNQRFESLPGAVGMHDEEAGVSASPQTAST